MLEKRTNQGILRLIQPKEGGCDTTQRSLAGENVPVARNRSGDGGCEVETRRAQVDETNDTSGQLGMTKANPVVVSTPLAVEKPTPHVNPAVGKLTYNPITHAPSTTPLVSVLRCLEWYYFSIIGSLLFSFRRFFLESGCRTSRPSQNCSQTSSTNQQWKFNIDSMRRLYCQHGNFLRLLMAAHPTNSPF